MDFLQTTIACLRIVLHDFTFKDPNFDPDDAISSHSLNLCVVDVSAKSVQRHTTRRRADREAAAQMMRDAGAAGEACLVG